MAKPRPDCPECKLPLERIQVMDATLPQDGVGARHVTLSFAATDAQPKGVLRGINPSGVIFGMMCPECGRVLLYGERR